MDEHEQMRIFYEVFDAAMPRLGPGEEASTKKALDKVLSAASGGSSYSNTLSRWYPRTTGKFIELTGGIQIGSVANGASFFVMVYKNGSYYSTVRQMGRANTGNTILGGTWIYEDSANTNTNDYYEIYYNLTDAAAITGTYSNNWWSGNAE